MMIDLARIRGRVAVAMSGGVDSSVVASMLVEAGVDCVGLTMQVGPEAPRAPLSGKSRGCCTLQEVHDAQRVAWDLGIPHYTLNLREGFETAVISDFVAEYVAGRTPNPCIRCNRHVKFGLLLERARALGAEHVATGHYARIDAGGPGGRLRLLKGVAPGKDQSYVLYSLTQEQLDATLFPLGTLDKAATREMAHRAGLCTAEKRDSVEICFIPDGEHAAFIRRRAPEAMRPGPVVHVDGRVLGTHAGLPAYTVGQRKGLGISAPEPLYVVRLDAATNTVVVGPAGALVCSRFEVVECNWVSLPEPREDLEVTVRTRYNGTEAEAMVIPIGSRTAEVRVPGGVRAVTPGQAAVFYRGDVVIGGGIIFRRQE